MLKLPRSNGGSWREAIAIEINPINQKTLFLPKKRGIVIKSTAELEEISKILTNPKTSELTRLIDSTNPPEVKSKEKDDSNSDIIKV